MKSVPAQKHPGRKRPPGKEAERRKLTLSLSARTDARLDALARRDGKSRSETAERILSDGLRGVVIRFEGAQASPADEPFEGAD
jgi:hypothetical protein